MLFETVETKVEATDRNLLTFKDCPNHCKNGKIFDFATHTETECEYCADKRRRMVQEGLTDEEYGSVNKILKLPKTFRGYTLKADDLFNNFADGLLEYTDQSVADAKEEINKLLTNISAGIQPNYSLALQLPHLFNEYDFIATLLIRSYIAGFVTAPMITSIDLVNLRREYENGKTERADGLTYNYFINADTVVVYLDNGVTSQGLNAVFGFTNLRSTKYKPTIIIAKTKILKKENFSLNPDYKFYKIVEFEKKTVAQMQKLQAERQRNQAKNNTTPQQTVGRPNLSSGVKF